MQYFAPFWISFPYLTMVDGQITGLRKAYLLLLYAALMPHCRQLWTAGCYYFIDCQH